MKRINTHGIVLARTDFGEADRILTFLTPDNGKVKAIAKGVRKQKSKMAGGIELFSVSEISFIVGRSEINTLISTRLLKHYGNIVKDLNRTSLTYEIIKTVNKATQDQPEEAYFNLLRQAFEALNDPKSSLDLVSAWFYAQLLKLAGHSPNLRSQKTGEKLQAGQKYDFNYDAMSFEPGKKYTTNDIKFLRLLFMNTDPIKLQKVNGADKLSGRLAQLIRPLIEVFLGS